MTKTVVIETKKGKVDVVGRRKVADLTNITGRVSIGTMTTSGAGTVRIIKF